MRSLPALALSSLALLSAACGAGALPSAAPPRPYDAFRESAGSVSDDRAEAAPRATSDVESKKSLAAPMPVAAAAPSRPRAQGPASVARPAAAPQAGKPAAAAAKSASPTGSKADDVSAPDGFILYTGSLALTVEESRLAPTIDRVIDAAIEAGGHIGSRRDASVTVVVPSAAFRRTFAAVEALGDVTHRTIAAEDVSEEYHDAEVRLSNLRSTRKRLEEFLARAPSISEMLTVEHELERISMDIDRIEGRMRYLREHTAFSTLTVELFGKPKPVSLVVPPPPPPPPPRALDVRARWLDELGADRLESGK